MGVSRIRPASEASRLDPQYGFECDVPCRERDGGVAIGVEVGDHIATTVRAHVTDTGLFVACGRQQNNTYVALERFARRNDLVRLIPERVYKELGGAPARSTPGQTPIDSGWVVVADPPDYTNSTVASVMDDVRRCIASASNRPEDTIEKADTALAAVIVQLFRR